MDPFVRSWPRLVLNLLGRNGKALPKGSICEKLAAVSAELAYVFAVKCPNIGLKSAGINEKKMPR